MRSLLIKCCAISFNPWSMYRKNTAHEMRRVDVDNDSKNRTGECCKTTPMARFGKCVLAPIWTIQHCPVHSWDSPRVLQGVSWHVLNERRTLFKGVRTIEVRYIRNWAPSLVASRHQWHMLMESRSQPNNWFGPNPDVGKRRLTGYRHFNFQHCPATPIGS